MARWADVEREAPELAAHVRKVFDAHKHKTLATLRADGSPRISGTEVSFFDGDVWIGSMPDARKGADLKRDPRFALHSAPVDDEMKDGDAKISGRFELARGDDFQRYAKFLAQSDEPQVEGSFDAFRADITEVVTVRVDQEAELLIIETWREGHNGLRRIERR